jgi:ribosomal protein S18 acetylase RimI-like enzyme
MQSEILYRKFSSGLGIVRDRGILEFVRELKKKFYFHYKAYWYVYDLTIPKIKSSVTIPNFKVSNDLVDETLAWMKNLAIPGLANPIEIENILNESHWIYTVVSDGLIAGYLKIGKGRVFVTDLNRELHFPRDSAFIMDTFIHQNFRRRKLFHFLISEVINDLISKHYSYIYCHIRNDNIASISAFEKCGFKRIGNILYRKILWKEILAFPPHLLSSDISVS